MGCRGVRVLIALGALAVGCSGDSGTERGADGRVIEAGNVSSFELQAGDCLVAPDEVSTEIGDVRVVPCGEQHTQEVVAVLELDDDEGDDFPGDEEVTAYADAACLEPFAGYVGVDYVDSSLFLTYLVPTVRSWSEEGDREVVCIAQTTGELLDESVKGSRR